jgi:hypothetical protein
MKKEYQLPNYNFQTGREKANNQITIVKEKDPKLLILYLGAWVLVIMNCPCSELQGQFMRGGYEKPGLPFQGHQFLKNLICRRDDFRICLKSSLSDDHLDKLSSKIDI